MGEVVNLRLQRKRAARRAAEAEATDNRIAHGMPKAIRELAVRHATMDTQRLDGHRLDIAAAEPLNTPSVVSLQRDDAS